MDLTVEAEIALINEIITSAIYHGGDRGGAYYSDWLGLESAIGEWLKARGLTYLYTPYDDKIASISKVSVSDLSSDEYIWYLRVPALDAKGKRLSAAQKWEEIQREGLQTHRPGVKFQLGCDKKANLPFSFQQEEEECVVVIDIVGAELNNECVFYREKEDGVLFADDIPSRYLSLCRTKVMEVNDVLSWSGYEVYYTEWPWSKIDLRNLAENKYIRLNSDGSFYSRDPLSSELIDSLRKAHEIYWNNNL
ncbi:MAG: hypothetical protein K5697_00010 [Lachnospiraceae bacterium]|nr:hypothetical protein [Lachnospiraceae bacterium]